MMKILEGFNDLSAWQTDGAPVITDGELHNSQAAASWLWRELPAPIVPGSRWRLDIRVRVQGSAASNDRMYVGVTDGELGSHPDTHNRFSLGVRHHVGAGAQPEIVPPGGSPSRINTYEYEDGEVYRLSLASDGRTVSAAVYYDASGDNLSRNCMELSSDYSAATFNHLYIVFRTLNAPKLVSVAYSDDLNGYGVEEFNAPLELVTYYGDDPTEKMLIHVSALASGANRAVLCCHGTGGNENNFRGPSHDYYQPRLGHEGYSSAAVSLGEHWGNWQGVSRLRRARDRLMNLLPLHFKQFVVGSSMGGFMACNYARAYPDLVAGIGLKAASTNLDWRYYLLDGSTTDRESEIHAAYDCTADTYHTATRGRNPAAHADELTRFPVIARHTPGDTLVPIVHARSLHAAITAYGGAPTLEEYAEGGHGGTGRYNAAGDAAFFDAVPDTDLARPPRQTVDVGGVIRVR